MATLNTKKSQKQNTTDSDKESKPSDKKAKPGKNSKSPLKRSTLGFEVEFFILDKNGNVVNEADRLLKKIEEKKGSLIIKEAVENIIEVGSYPSIESINTLKDLLDNLKILLYTADEENLMICPLGTYPGKFTPKTRRDARYKVQELLFGKNKFRNAGRCIGYHCHYALPWGVFDYKKLTLKKLINSKNKQSLVNAYNFLVAADPALTTFMQSSPFYQGHHLAKDSRMLVYRGGDEVDYKDGLYANQQRFGALPFYEHTGSDIIDLIHRRNEEWFKTLREVGVKESQMPKYKSPLDINWSPVKINSHGTLEQRGMDMNHPLMILSVSFAIKVILREIQEGFLKVETSDVALDEPFKFDKKTIYLPPDTHVKKELQKWSAYQGLENEKVWYYCKRLLGLAKLFSEKKKRPFLEPLEKVIKDKKTVSDDVIAQAKKLGHEDFKKEMPKEIAAEIAVDHSRKLFEEIVLAQKFIEEIK